MLFAHVEKEILNIIASDNLESNFSIQLAYSGGIDSSCLLDALYRLKSEIKFNLYLTYVNYNTSSYSLYVSEHIKTLPLDIIKRVESIKIDSDYNFESKAREARYSILDENAQLNKINYTFTAHHMNDQIETLIMKFIDGSDLISMSGIRRKLNNIYRPILRLDKKIIEDYAKKHNIIYFKDPSNNTLSFRRNKIRKLVVPLVTSDSFLFKKIKEMNDKSLIVSKEIRRTIKVDLRESVIEYLDKIEVLSIGLGKILNYDVICFKLFLKLAMKKYFGINNIQKSNKFWLKCLSFLNNAKVGSVFIVSDKIRLFKDRDSAFLINEAKIVFKNKIKVSLDKENDLLLGKVSVDSKKPINIDDKYSYLVSKDDVEKGIFVRSWKYGDRVQLDKGSKKVSDLFIDFKLPLFKKGIYPIFENSDREILWIPGMYSRKQSNKLKSVFMIWGE